MEIKKEVLCVECYKALSNPVCFDCMKEELVEWLREENLDFEERKKIFHMINVFFDNYSYLNYSVDCIICGRKRPTLCNNCFRRFTALLLQKIKVNREDLRKFMTIFTY